MFYLKGLNWINMTNIDAIGVFYIIILLVVCMLLYVGCSSKNYASISDDSDLILIFSPLSINQTFHLIMSPDQPYFFIVTI